MSKFRIGVQIESSFPLSISADPNEFGAVFARMSDDDQVAVLRAMVEHMRPHQIQWDFIAIELEKTENSSVRSALKRALFPADCNVGGQDNAAPDLLAALEAIAARGGNISDERLTTKTGANDAIARGLMYVEARGIARSAITKARGTS